MTTAAELQALKQTRGDCLQAWPLNQTPEAAGGADHPLRPPAFMREHLPTHPDKADAESGALAWVRWLEAETPQLAAEILQADVDALQSLAAEQEVTLTRPCGLQETLFPVAVAGSLIGVLWSGKYRTAAPDDADVNTWAQSAAINPSALATALSNLPVWSVEDAERHLAQLRYAARTLSWGLMEKQLHADSVQQWLDSERVRSLGTLSGGVAHHFNNLLSVILGYASFLLNRTDDNEEAHAALRAISESAQKGRRLTQEILAFAGSEVEEETSCSLHDIVNGVLSLLEGKTSGKIRISTALEADADAILAPRSVLHQAVFNLLINGIESLPQGGTLTVQTEQTDAGASIRMKVVHQSDAAPATKPDSSHLPDRLLSVQGMIDPFEGALTQAVDESQAVQVDMTLPIEQIDQPEEAPAPVSKRLAASRIWVVDDDAIFCQMCERVLQDDGHQVSTLPSGPAMQAAFAEQPHPELLIIDFSMPEASGLELCEWLRENGCQAPVILVSGFAATQPDIHQALKMRKTYFLQKPFPVPELADMVSVALGETLLGVK
jgi:CheY-like chemotaxis protein